MFRKKLAIVSLSIYLLYLYLFFKMFLLCCHNKHRPRNKIDGFLKETAFSSYRYNIYLSP